MITHVRYKPRLFTSLLFSGLLLSFLWCVLENITTNARIINIANTSPVSVNTITTGYLWLVGHGVHGTAVFVLPSLYWRRLNAPKKEEKSWPFEIGESFYDTQAFAFNQEDNTLTHLFNTNISTKQNEIADIEQNILYRLKNLLIREGVFIDPLFVEKFYASLKSSSSLLLVGPAQTGKLTMLDCVGELLTDAPAQHFQKMVGHAFWASGSHNVALFVDAQKQQNMQHLLKFLEEAAQPENANRLFIACLSRISPAEVDANFSLPGFKPVQNATPIPFPPNFRLIGTMDTSKFRWWSRELLLQTAVLHWPINTSSLFPKIPYTRSPLQATNSFFIQGCIRDERAAYARLLDLLGDRQSFAPFMMVVNVLHNHGIDLPREVINRAIIFAANTWTQNGNSIFTDSKSNNLTCSLDIALAQLILPWIIISECDNHLICKQLQQLLIQHGFIQSASYLNSL